MKKLIGVIVVVFIVVVMMIIFSFLRGFGILENIGLGIYAQYGAIGSFLFYTVIGGIFISVTSWAVKTSWKKITFSNEQNPSTNNNKIHIQKDINRNIVSFEIKDKNSWENIKLKLLEFYKQYDIEKVISDKEKSWMLGSDTIKGYVEATLSDSIITITSFKFPEPDMSIIKSETREDKTRKQTKMTSDVNHIVDENLLYEQVWDEIENNNKIKSLWSRAFAHSNGNLEQTKALYIKYRVEDLKINQNTITTSSNIIDKESDWDKKYARLEQEVRKERNDY